MSKVGDNSYFVRFHACKLLPKLRHFTNAIIIWSQIQSSFYLDAGESANIFLNMRGFKHLKYRLLMRDFYQECSRDNSPAL
jgi:hypothetical protein